MATKSDIRSFMLEKRDRLAAAEREKKSGEICREAQSHIAAVFKQPRIALYFPMRSEVDVQPLIQAAYQLGWTPGFPCMVFDDEEAGEGVAPTTMRFYRIPAQGYQQALGAFLKRPLLRHNHARLACDGYEQILPQDFDVVIVPLVAFDNRGNRLGYGGGNYDRFLPQLRPDALVLGVAFEEQRIEAVPCDHLDQPLPQIIAR